MTKFGSYLVINIVRFGGDEMAKAVKAWIWDRVQTYVDFLGGFLQDDEKKVNNS